MPGLIDKILINDRRDEGNHRAIRAELRNLKMLGREIQERGLLGAQEAEAFKGEMKRVCADYNAAQAKYLQELQSLTGRLADWFDSEII